nr:hypothetical protein [uncultured Flavobacterium sp.]
MKYQTDDPKWVSFYPTFRQGFYIEKAGYFDERPQVNTSITQLIALLSIPILCYFSLYWLFLLPLILFGWGRLYIRLPIKTGIQDCDSAAWGINYHNNKFWIYVGGAGNFEGGKKWKTITMPWDMKWVRTSTKMKDGYDWFHETKDNKFYWNGNEETAGTYAWRKKNRWSETYDYTDTYDGTVVKATISLCEMEWRPLLFQWTRLFAKKRTYIDVEFSEGIGKGKGSWKGGTVGCSYTIKPDETPLDCLRRMESERDF